MKQKFLLPFALAGMVALTGCDESNDPAISKEERVQLVLDRLDKNETISYDMFKILEQRMSSDSLTKLMKSVKSKEKFINVVASQTDDYFDEVLKGGIAEFDITTVPKPFHGDAEITLKALASKESAGATPVDLIGEYSKLILTQAGVQAKGGHDKWIVLQSFSVPGTAPGAQATEQVSLNYSEIKMLATLPHGIIMDLKLSDDEVLEAIDDVLKANEIPPIAIALLLPAVQKVRESAPAKQPFKEAMNAWLDGPITQANDHGLDRDIIRRIQATVYLAALHTILLEEYDGSNEDMASLSVLHARYRAAVIMGTTALWD